MRCVCRYWGVSGFTGLVFFFFVSFLVRGSGLSTSFCVTSLYVDAAPQGGPAILKCECGLLDYKKKKKKKKVWNNHRELRVFHYI